MKFPMDYPYSPPSVRFLCKMWHPNIYEVCNDNICSHKNCVERDRDRQRIRQSINQSYANTESMPNSSFKMTVRMSVYRIS